MWRRTYLLLMLIRLYLALSPSYLHPDENFQGPEVIAGRIFSYPVRLTWEFTSEHPIRSVLPLWPVYGLPMVLLRWVWSGGEGRDDDYVNPALIYWALRSLMFVLSFVLEDWAIYELVQSPRHRRVAILLVASSYVTATFQTHTFSNSIETLLVLWSIVLCQRIIDEKDHSSILSSSILGFLVVFGVFNRITFPAFLILPGLRLIPVLLKKHLGLLCLLLSAFSTFVLAVAVDTSFYSSSPRALTLSDLWRAPVLTPLNNLLYNTSTSNLALHGLHPYYQHLLFNLPQLLGPATLFIPYSLFTAPTARLGAAITGVLALSTFSHQEPRFLMPAIPLILSAIRIPLRGTSFRIFLSAWIGFNLVMATLMGVYHQGGVVPTQINFANQPDEAFPVDTHIFWWKTYTPPVWLLDGKNANITTHDLMGLAPSLLRDQLVAIAPCQGPDTDKTTATYLVAPDSATYLDRFPRGPSSLSSTPEAGNVKVQEDPSLTLELTYNHPRHLNLDDLDFGDDGVWNTLTRVIGRRGLSTWRVTKDCRAPPS
ncbi:MAG: hypothetical protein M4579_000484 [Chaenotheca gracillima]|nr:MAG: hypothetical protein M4579_000484 [Chaenotheca gracillima]